MTEKKDTAFTYFEAKPKRGNEKIVNEKIGEVAGLFAETFDKNRRNCTFHPEKRGKMSTVLIIFESEEAKGLLEQDPRFQEAMTDLRAFCKPAHRLKRALHYMLHPGKPFVITFKAPVSYTDQIKPAER